MKNILTEKEIKKIEEVLRNVDGITYEGSSDDYTDDWDFYCEGLTLKYSGNNSWLLIVNTDILELTFNKIQDIEFGIWGVKKYDVIILWKEWKLASGKMTQDLLDRPEGKELFDEIIYEDGVNYEFDYVNPEFGLDDED